MKTSCLLLVLVSAATTACSNRASVASDDAPNSNAIVLRGADMRPGNVLDALRGRAATMTITTGRTGECPRIVFRGQRSVQNQDNPGVYVDGTRMLDTCILTQLSTAEIDVVEIYPSGNTTRPNITRNPFGLILIYLRR
jgi:hypothetical protein